MKIPKRPPAFGQLLEEVGNSKRLSAVVDAIAAGKPLADYPHWDKLVHLPPPKGITHREWWFGLKWQRAFSAVEAPLADAGGRRFRFTLPDPLPQRLHEIDLGAGGVIELPDQVANPETRDRYYMASLMEEAITSSQLEGAHTTREVAQEMLRSGRGPRDNHERMIFNNFTTMRRIREIKDKPLTPSLVFELHRILTEGTLDDPADAGRHREPHRKITVQNMYGDLLHEPPPAEQLEKRLSLMCDFANGSIPDRFIHPVVRSIILHFWLAFDHPFVDGNGRTARALFYWSMIRSRYWLFEFISISHVILKAPNQYGLAFLHTETDDNDLTYFIHYHLDLIHKAIQQLHTYIREKTRQLQNVEGLLRLSVELNHRQRALLSHALRHPGFKYTIESHRSSHDIVHETARTDLMKLRDKGLLQDQKIGRTFYFVPVANLERKLSGLR